MEHDLDKEHGRSIEEIHVHLVANKISIVPLGELNNSKQAPEDDDRSREEKKFEQFGPVILAVLWDAVHFGRIPHSFPEDECDDEEEAEEEELDKESEKHDIFALDA
jgi:hypothetical protein